MEPIVSMGDWRKERKGLTKRERGIPLQIFRQIICDTGFKVIKETKCMFSLTSRLKYFTKEPVYNSKIAMMLDSWFCRLLGWNTVYHTKNSFLKLRPTSVFYVLQKPLANTYGIHRRDKTVLVEMKDRQRGF